MGFMPYAPVKRTGRFCLSFVILFVCAQATPATVLVRNYYRAMPEAQIQRFLKMLAPSAGDVLDGAVDVTRVVGYETSCLNLGKQDLTGRQLQHALTGIGVAGSTVETHNQS